MEPRKRKVLFVCVHNGARSQMAEAFLRKYGSAYFESESAGLEPGNLNAVVVEVMKEDGVDISKNKTKDVFGFLRDGKTFHYVVTVCDETSAERCPVFPGVTERLHWSFPDPSALSGSRDHILTKTREIRDSIKKRVIEFVQHETQQARNNIHGT